MRRCRANACTMSGASARACSYYMDLREIGFSSIKLYITHTHCLLKNYCLSRHAYGIAANMMLQHLWSDIPRYGCPLHARIGAQQKPHHRERWFHVGLLDCGTLELSSTRCETCAGLHARHITRSRHIGPWYDHRGELNATSCTPACESLLHCMLST